MKIEIDNARLRIIADEQDLQDLRTMADIMLDGQLAEIDSEQAQCDFLQRTIESYGLEWINPSITGDLTDAPMLAELGDEEPGATDGVLSGRWPDAAGVLQTWSRPVLRRWAFMDYQVISVLQRILNTGSAVFISGESDANKMFQGEPEDKP